MRILIVFFLSLCLISCDKTPQQRTYEEVVVLSSSHAMMSTPNDPHAFLKNSKMKDKMLPDMETGATSQMLEASVAQIPLSWQVPDGWIEEKGSGMRLVTFTSKDSDPVECSIVSLGGMAGGLEANIKRWLNQIGLNSVSSVDLEKFLKNQTEIQSPSGLKGQLIDFTQLQINAPETTPTMIAAIFNIDETSVFVKMTGSKKSVLNNQKEFNALCSSLVLNHD